MGRIDLHQWYWPKSAEQLKVDKFSCCSNHVSACSCTSPLLSNLSCFTMVIIGFMKLNLVQTFIHYHFPRDISCHFKRWISLVNKNWVSRSVVQCQTNPAECIYTAKKNPMKMVAINLAFWNNSSCLKDPKTNFKTINQNFHEFFDQIRRSLL